MTALYTCKLKDDEEWLQYLQLPESVRRLHRIAFAFESLGKDQGAAEDAALDIEAVRLAVMEAIVSLPNAACWLMCTDALLLLDYEGDPRLWKMAFQSFWVES